MENKEVALMYSGGLDTTRLALQLAQAYDKVHLLTFCNGFCVRVNASRKHAELLREKYTEDRIEHTVFSIAQTFAVLKKGLAGEMVKYRSPLLFDLCCRLSMEVATIVYCVKRGVRYAADGSNPRTQGEMFIQQEEYLREMERLFGEYGIRYVRMDPGAGSRKEILGMLKTNGIGTGIPFLEDIGITSQLFTQPFCLWAPVAFFFTSRLRHLPFIKCFGLPVEKALRFRAQKVETAKGLIDYLILNDTLAHIYPCKKDKGNRFINARKC